MIKMRDQRMATRLPTRLAVNIKFLSFDAEVYAQGIGEVENVSRTGIGLRRVRLMQGRLPLSPCHIVVVPIDPELRGVWIKALAVHLRYGRDGATVGGTIERTSVGFEEIVDRIPLRED